MTEDADSGIVVSERLSRRRKAKGSSIVLTSERVQKCEAVNDKTDTPKVVPSLFSSPRLSNLSERPSSLYSTRSSVGKRYHISAGIITSWFRRRTQRIRAAALIVIWYRRQKHHSERLRRYTQGWKWTRQLADRVFSRLVLGPRVRAILRCDKVRAVVVEINDLKSVVGDIVKQRDKLTDYEACHYDHASLMNTDLVSGLTTSDATLARGSMKQYLHCKEAFHKFFFAGATWQPFPRPGYLDLSSAVERRFSDAEIVRSPAATRAARRQSLGPSRSHNYASHQPLPHHQQQQLLQQQQQQNYRRSHHQAQNIAPTNILDEDTLDIITLPPDLKTGLPKRLPSPYRDPAPSSSSSSLSSAQTSGINSSSAVPASLMVSSSKRSGSRAHIQLDILSADRLMPAKKGSHTRDALGEIVPDRKPCIKVALFLPASTSSSSSSYTTADKNGGGGLRKVLQMYREYDVTTLNPRWGDTFYLSLPCPKRVVVTAGDSYEARCEELLKWWSAGTIVIQIVDGERFNEEIFLGEVSLLLSTLMVPGGSVANGQPRRKHCLEATGSYSLNKVQTTDRVSGVLQLHAYLHLPSASFLDDLLFRKGSLDGSEAISNSYGIQMSPETLFINRNDGAPSSSYSGAGAVVSSKVLSQQTLRKLTSKSSSSLNSASPSSVLAASPSSIRTLTSPSASAVTSPLIPAFHQPHHHHQQQQTKRMSIIADVAKCLSSVSAMQVSADEVIHKMNQRLIAKQLKDPSAVGSSAALSDMVKALPISDAEVQEPDLFEASMSMIDNLSIRADEIDDEDVDGMISEGLLTRATLSETLEEFDDVLQGGSDADSEEADADELNQDEAFDDENDEENHDDDVDEQEEEELAETTASPELSWSGDGDHGGAFPASVDKQSILVEEECLRSTVDDGNGDDLNDDDDDDDNEFDEGDDVQRDTIMLVARGSYQGDEEEDDNDAEELYDEDMGEDDQYIDQDDDDDDYIPAPPLVNVDRRLEFSRVDDNDEDEDSEEGEVMATVSRTVRGGSIFGRLDDSTSVSALRQARATSVLLSTSSTSSSPQPPPPPLPMALHGSNYNSASTITQSVAARAEPGRGLTKLLNRYQRREVSLEQEQPQQQQPQQPRIRLPRQHQPQHVSNQSRDGDDSDEEIIVIRLEDSHVQSSTSSSM